MTELVTSPYVLRVWGAFACPGTERRGGSRTFAARPFQENSGSSSSRSSCGPFSALLRRDGSSSPSASTARGARTGRAGQSCTIVACRPGPDKRPCPRRGSMHAGTARNGARTARCGRPEGYGYGRCDRVGPRDRSEDGSDPVRCGAPGSSFFIQSGGASGQPACPPAKEGGDARGRTIIIDTSRFRGRPGALGAKWAMRAHFCWWLSSACRSTARLMDHSIDR